MSGTTGRSNRRREDEEEHENHERWLVTYADMLTVLMALFIVMFAMSVVDKTKFEQLKAGLDTYFGHGPQLVDGGSGLLAKDSGTDSTAVDVAAAVAAFQDMQVRTAAVAEERDNLAEAQHKITAALQEKGLAESVRFRIDERGLVVTIVTDQVLFDLGSASLRPAGREVLDGIGPALVPLPNPVTVEGHTDDLPIRGGRFASNWELSTERSTTVLRYLLETHGMPAARLGAAGYADQRPVSATASRAENRRVEVIVRATAAAAGLPVAAPTAETPAAAPATAPAPAAQGAARTDEETD